MHENSILLQALYFFYFNKNSPAIVIELYHKAYLISNVRWGVEDVKN